jgi:hypothetical protein
MVKCGVFFAVRPECLNIVLTGCGFKGLKSCFGISGVKDLGTVNGNFERSKAFCRVLDAFVNCEQQEMESAW